MTPGSATALAAARERTLELLAPLTDDELSAQHSPLMSPLVWDLAHIAHYEEIWLVRELGAGDATDTRFDDVYDAFKHPRAERPDLDILGPQAARDFGAAVRDRVLRVRGVTGSDPRVDAVALGEVEQVPGECGPREQLVEGGERTVLGVAGRHGQLQYLMWMASTVSLISSRLNS